MDFLLGVTTLRIDNEEWIFLPSLMGRFASSLFPNLGSDDIQLLIMEVIVEEIKKYLIDTAPLKESGSGEFHTLLF